MPVGDQKNERARVNLEYKSKIEGGRSKKLPYRMMVLGNYSPSHAEKEKDIVDRRAWQIDKATFNQTMAEMAPELEIVVDNKLEESAPGDDKKIGVHLKFKTREDFHPEKILQQVPELAELVKIRDLVKDLRARMVKSDDLRKSIESILRDPALRAKLESELTSRQASEGPAESTPESVKE